MPDANKEPSEIKNKLIRFLISIWLILCGKKDTKDEFTMIFISSLLVAFFRIFSLIFLIADFIVIYDIAKYFIAASQSIFSIIFIALIGLLLLFASFILFIGLWVASNELKKSKDNFFILSVFSGIVSLLALIASIIAFIKV